ncbi:MAG: CBS domain-containing protein [Chloroflexi bacterium]|nr:CBS domain-containing protein [Chloroflexota bacterium]
MTRVFDVMTRSVATTAPDTPIEQVAALMRDLNIGDVLVVQDEKLCGIVTDRDLAIQALPNGVSKHTPVKTVMTADVITGQPEWSLEQVAQVMGKHQIRRLPIVEQGHVVGIVSLGDVALHLQNPKPIAASLHNISEATRPQVRRIGPMVQLLGVALPVLVAAGAIFFGTRTGQRFRKQWKPNALSNKARAAVQETVRALQAPETRRAALQALQDAELASKTRQSLESVRRSIEDSDLRKRATDLAAQVQKRQNVKSNRFAKLRAKSNGLFSAWL